MYFRQAMEVELTLQVLRLTFMLIKVVFFTNVAFMTGVYGPGTYAYQAAHNLILAHAKAYRLYERSFKPTQLGALFFIV